MSYRLCNVFLQHKWILFPHFLFAYFCKQVLGSFIWRFYCQNEKRTFVLCSSKIEYKISPLTSLSIFFLLFKYIYFFVFLTLSPAIRIIFYTFSLEWKLWDFNINVLSRHMSEDLLLFTYICHIYYNSHYTANCHCCYIDMGSSLSLTHICKYRANVTWVRMIVFTEQMLRIRMSVWRFCLFILMFKLSKCVCLSSVLSFVQSLLCLMWYECWLSD